MPAVIKPDNSIVRFNDVKTFCKNNDYWWLSVHNVLSNESGMCQGSFFMTDEWFRTPPKEKYKYKALKPSGDVIYFSSPSWMCSRYNLSKSSIARCIQRVQYDHHNWKFTSVGEDFPKDPYYIGISPDGEKYEFENATHFAKKYDLTPQGICISVSKGTKHKGWEFDKAFR